MEGWALNSPNAWPLWASAIQTKNPSPCMWWKWTGMFVSNVAISKMRLNKIKCASADWDVVKTRTETIAVKMWIDGLKNKSKREFTSHCVNIPGFNLKFLPIMMQSLEWCIYWEILGNHQVLRHSPWHANNEMEWLPILQDVNFGTSNIFFILRKNLLLLHKELGPYKNIRKWTVKTNASC